ncbi:hypothetical protein [Komagataeibacter xylinus]|uniref:hypothetical protein n=1 Tax=Komagataeibacter xylinus TaxID=28448 RepID=UPI00280AD2B7|nr:hypothetical protein [Komagataeibacter xylinus]
MSDNSGVLVGYWLPATITAEHIEDACAALGYEIASEATGEEPAAMLMRILMAMGQPVVFTGNASDHGIKITTNESGEQRIWQLVFRDEMEVQVAAWRQRYERIRWRFLQDAKLEGRSLTAAQFDALVDGDDEARAAVNEGAAS